MTDIYLIFPTRHPCRHLIRRKRLRVCRSYDQSGVLTHPVECVSLCYCQFTGVIRAERTIQVTVQLLQCCVWCVELCCTLHFICILRGGG